MSAYPHLALVTGPEDVLAERAIAVLVEQARAADPTVDVVRLDAEGYEPGSLVQHASPSLFGGGTCIVVRGIEAASDDLQADLLDYLAAPDETVTLIGRHAGGNRGRKVVTAFQKQGAHVTDCPAIKTDRDKSDFVSAEFRRANRQVTPEAVHALVAAVGSSVSELASACAQLVADTQGRVDVEVVERYHGGKVEASAFRVADAAIAGQTGESLRLLRHALANRVDPVPIVAVLAGQLRQLVQVGSASGGGRSGSGQLAKSLGMAPWQVDRARRALQGWTGPALGVAIQAVAAADEAVKGGGRDPVYAVERAILDIGRARDETGARG